MSYRIARLPWTHHRIEYFLLGIVVFWVLALLYRSIRFQLPRTLEERIAAKLAIQASRSSCRRKVMPTDPHRYLIPAKRHPVRLGGSHTTIDEADFASSPPGKCHALPSARM